MKKTILSALIALLISVPAIYVGGVYFYILSILLAIIAYNELLRLLIPKFSIKLIANLLFLCLLLSSLFKTDLNLIISYPMIGLVILIFSLMTLYYHKSSEFDIHKCFMLIGMTIFLGVAFSTLIVVRNMSLPIFIYILLIPIFTDIFANSVETLFGKHKINEISPNKTWEGFLGGIFFGVLISVLFYSILVSIDINIFKIITITLFLSIIGQCGNLFFSLIKKQFAIKDFSNLVPGYGGVLDQFDSILFVMLAFIYFVTWL